MPNRSGRVPIELITFVLLVGIVFSTYVIGLPFEHSFIALLGVFVFLIAFVNTDIALVIIILSMLLSPELRAGTVPTRAVNIRVEDLLIFVVFFGWMAKMATKKELGVLRKSPLNMPIGLYMVVCIVSSLLAVMDGRLNMRETTFYLLKYFEYYLLFFMVGNNLHTLKQVKLYLFFLMATCFVVCVMGWLQIPAGERLSAPFEQGGGEPNTLAGYLLLMMAMILAFAMNAVGQRQRLLWLGFFVFALVPFIFTLSREGWFSFLPMIAAFIVFNRRWRYLLMVLLLLGIIFVPRIMPTAVHERFADTFATDKSYDILGKKFSVSESTAARIDTWERGFWLLGKRPFIGSGVPSGGMIDNQYVRVLVETGTMGFLIYAWIVFLLFQLARTAYRLEDGYARAIGMGFICGLVALLAQSFGAAIFVLIRIMEPFWFLAAIVAVLPEIVQQEEQQVQD